jgi:serine-type D-Ala-D-Ala carboxypeptidase (penicillin-binding protein 5/6)
MADKPKERRFDLWFFIIFIVLVLIIYVYWAINKAQPPIAAVKPVVNISGSTAPGAFPWPSYGQSAIGLNDSGVQATGGTQKPVPMASTAKLITALCVLNKKPLSLGEQGPTITLTQADVNLDNKYIAEDGSHMVVVAGEKITEYQMLQGMLLPSADNIADSLATWAFGSLDNYKVYASQYLQSHALTSTYVGIDASGFDPSSMSTASDLVKIGELSLQNPVLAQIVAQPSASGIPVVGTIRNVNTLLGQDNIVGIKTGNTNQAGGVFVSASKVNVNQQPVTVLTAIMGAPSLWRVLNDSQPLINAAQANFSIPTSISSIHTGSVVGEYIVPWSKQKIEAVSSGDIQAESWKGTEVSGSIKLSSISFSTKQGQSVGTITTSDSLLKTNTITNVTINATPTKPSRWWVIFHPTYVL